MVDRENNIQKGKTSVIAPTSVSGRSRGKLPSYPCFERKTPQNFVENYVLPSRYNNTQITLLARDPFWVYAYWDVGESSLEAIEMQLGSQYSQAVLTIRMYDVTCIDFNGTNANSFFDVDVGFHSHNWYINLWQDYRSFCADLGFRLPDGRFLTLARSNFVHTPRISSSGRSDMMWMEINDREISRSYVLTGGSARKKAGQGHSKAQKSRRRKMYLSEDDIRSYYGNLLPLYRRIRNKKLELTNFSQPQKNFSGEDVRAGMLPDEIYNPGPSRSKFLRKLLGSSAEFLEKGGASEKSFQLEKGASERHRQQRQFFFEIWTELIVYGRTEPDAEVLLGKQKIKLRPDGTFTLRYALPDGKIPLDFMAQSADKIDRRTITTSVERAKTLYHP